MNEMQGLPWQKLFVDTAPNEKKDIQTKHPNTFVGICYPYGLKDKPYSIAFVHHC